MKKRIIHFVVLLLIVAPSFAQFRTGVKGGGNISNINMNMGGVELEIYEPRMGVHAGFMAEYMFGAHFGLHSELMYFYSGAAIDSEKYMQGLEVPDGASLEGYVDMHTFQLPLYLKTKFAVSPNAKLYVMGGGFATFAPTANQHMRTSYEQESIKVKWSLFEPKIRILDTEESNVYMQQRWNVGLAAEIGAEIMDKITVGVGFRHVLNNMAAFGYMVGGGSLKPTTQMWTASVSVGYFF
ncbi:hypothetical protein SDC9_98152 [bioreactor metagenome]|uniref:Outer membrane protein beta-barrel domain-containing protein n=1 Tax=bioreactor metagenome TaxID=1076179 RepID=A0A645AP74_9ZZZZ